MTINGCRSAYSVTTGVVTRTVGTRCHEPVVSYLIDGMGHSWPGGNSAMLTAAASFLGPYSDAVSANDVMWRFFRSVA